MANRIQLRRDSYDNWNNTNPILADGEPGLDYDSNKIKIGDGETQWSGLPYATELIASTLATVATSGSYTDLNNTPDNPVDLLGGRQVSNHLQFLRYNKFTDLVEFSTDFRIVPSSSVVYPNGTIGQDLIGDIAFSQGTTYYCYQQPNAYTISYADSNGWTPPGWLKVNSIGTSSTPPQVGDKVTDGTTTSTITSIPAAWQIQYADVRFMLIEISPAVSSWKNGAGDLTVYTGSAPHLNCWARIGSEVAAVPAHNNSDGIAGQVAYDSNYMYRCVQTSVPEISSAYPTPQSLNSPGNNQTNGANTVNVLNNGVRPAPQNGWIVSDGSSQRTVTNVYAQGSAWGDLYTLTLNSSIDWSTPTSLTLISQQAAAGLWKRIALNADTW